MTTDDLIERAASVLKPHTTEDGRLLGDVGAALVGDSGQVYTGVCVDLPALNICAERSAMAAMVTAGEYRIRTVVAVWRDPETNGLHVLPPCGVCREAMRQLDEANLDTQVILGRNETKVLKDLLPHHEWPEPLE